MNNERYNQIIHEAYENYVKWVLSTENQNNNNEIVKIPESKETFIKNIKGNEKLSETWGLKIEESELNYNERFRIAYKNIDLRKKLESETKMLHYPDGHNKVMDDAKIPTKLITVTYKEEKIEVYE